jgi:hypothetical protein
MSDPDDKSLLDELFGDAPDDSSDGAPAAPRPSRPPRTPSRVETFSVGTVRRLPGLLRSAGDPATAPGCREIGLTVTGFAIFISVDSVMMYTLFRISGPSSLLPQAVTLLFLAFGLGTLMVWTIRGAWRPVGIGMMLGWVFMTLISAGYFTGLNP